jgi:hypothetical protein
VGVCPPVVDGQIQRHAVVAKGQRCGVRFRIDKMSQSLQRPPLSVARTDFAGSKEDRPSSTFLDPNQPSAPPQIAATTAAVSAETTAFHATRDEAPVGHQ